MKKTIFLISLLLGFHNIAIADNKNVGTVSGFIPYSSEVEDQSGNKVEIEYFFFNLEESISNTPSCNSTKRFVMSSENPRFEATRSAVLAAKMAKTSITVRSLGKCDVWSNSEDLNYVCLGSIPC